MPRVTGDNGAMPHDLAPPPWVFPDLGELERAGRLPDDDLLATGADLEPATLLAAYRAGLFPMPKGLRGRRIGWWSPVERGILPLDRLRVTRSMRQSARRFEIRVDTAFDRVVEACADPRRSGGWISPAIRQSYGALHALGWAHSVECWQDGELVGGLYGVAVGGLFAGESMFHHVSDASKVALMGLVDLFATSTRTPGCSTCSGRPSTWPRSAWSGSPGRSTSPGSGRRSPYPCPSRGAEGLPQRPVTRLQKPAPGVFVDGSAWSWPGHQSLAGTVALTWATCWPQPAQVVLPQVLQVVGRHMVWFLSGGGGAGWDECVRRGRGGPAWR